MTIHELTPEEQLGLIGLLKVVIQADKLYTRKESAELSKVAKLMGAELFHAAVEQARARFKTLESIKEYVKGIDRPPARTLIYGLLQEMALADGLQPEEEGVLRWLAEEWQIA